MFGPAITIRSPINPLLTSPAPPVPFPAAALDFAEVLVAPHTRIEAELRALEQGQPEGQAAAAGAGPMDDVAAWRSFVGRPAAERMAVLSSLRGLLERTVRGDRDENRLELNVFCFRMT